MSLLDELPYQTGLYDRVFFEMNRIDDAHNYRNNAPIRVVQHLAVSVSLAIN